MPSSGADDSRSSGSVELKPWKVLETREIFSADPWFKLSVDQVLLPDGKVVDDYYQIAFTEYVVIFARTDNGEVITLRTYKHGVGGVCLVLPSGSIEKGEEPVESARRELLEETGYSADVWDSLGSFVVHGNYGCGRAHLFVARNARQIAEPDSGDLETMEVLLMQPAEILDAVRQGEVAGLGTVAAIGLALNPAFDVSDRNKTETGDAV